MAAAVPLCFAEVGLKTAPTLFASDAMGSEGGEDGKTGGYGIVAASTSEDIAMNILELGAQPGRAVVRLAPGGEAVRAPSKDGRRSQPFTRIPLEWLQSWSWTPVAHGRWLWHDHIVLGEARAALRIFVLLASFPEAHGHRIVSLEDNSSVGGAWTKGRSPSPALNFILRRRAAYSLAARLVQWLPWVQTDHMPADWLSRLA